MISRGECVDVLVSMGAQPKAFKMPELVGLTLEDALQSIEKLELGMGEIKSAFQKNRPRNSVVKQSPAPGDRVVALSQVSLLINREPQQKKPGQLHEQSSSSLFSYRLDSGFLKRHIRVSINSAGFTNDLFNDFVKAGDEIWLLIPRDHEATVFLYENNRLIKTQTYDAY